MKWLLDANVERAVLESLRTIELDVHWVPERDPGMPDQDVLEWAVLEGRCLVTSDKDFGLLGLRSIRKPPGIVLLRLSGDGRKKAARLKTLWPEVIRKLPGRFIVVGDDVLRERELL